MSDNSWATMSYFKGTDIEATYPHFRQRTSSLKLIEQALRRNGDATAMVQSSNNIADTSPKTIPRNSDNDQSKVTEGCAILNSGLIGPSFVEEHRVEGQSGKSASFREILQQGYAVAAGLRSAGVTAGDYIVICGDKSIIAYSLLVGVMFTGATAVIYPVPHVDILDKLTNGFLIKAVFCDASLLETLKLSMSRLDTYPLLVGIMDEQDEVVASLLSHPGDCVVFEVEDVTRHVPMVLFSSGTTGEPKGILLKDLYIQLSGLYFNFKFQAFFTASPLFWLSGLMFFISSIIYNYKVVFSNSSKHSDNLRLLQKYQVDGWFTGTGSLSRYINEPTLQHFDLSTLQKVFTGGESVLSSTLEDFMSKVLSNRHTSLHVMYGNTEGCMLAFYELQRHGGRFKTGACGKVWPGVEVKIVDDGGNLLPLRSLGTVAFKSLAMTPGYWGRPDLNKQLLDDDGFMLTGDAGFFDDEGYLYVRGRAGDLINFRGTKIAPAEVEDVLMSHPAVLDAAVVSKPHPSDIHHFTAFIVLNPNRSVTARELHDFANGKVEDNMKLRGGIHFLDILPRTIIGKIQRKKLRELCLDLS